jgi:hypothetical protein
MGRHNHSHDRHGHQKKSDGSDEDHRNRNKTTRDPNEHIQPRKNHSSSNKKRSHHHHHHRGDDSDDSDSPDDWKGKKHVRQREEERGRKRRKHSHDNSASLRDRHGSDDNDDDEHEKNKDQSRHRSRKRPHKRSDQKEKKNRIKCSHRDSKPKKRHSKHYNSGDEKVDASQPDKSLLFSMGSPTGQPPSTTLDVDKDYFSYHQEFWIYLFREEGIVFNDLDTKHAKKAFTRFAKHYNAGELEEPYYTRKFPAQVLEECKTSKHQWSFQTSEKERHNLELLQEGIRRQTEYNTKDTSTQQDRPDAS